MKVVHVNTDNHKKLLCLCPSELMVREGDLCVIEIHKMLELARVFCIREVEGEIADTDMPRVLRYASEQDRAMANENLRMNKIAEQTCRAKVMKYNLNMNILNVRYSLDRSTILITFTAPEYVDFKEMVKELTAELSARIQMRQLGVRDEAGLLGGIGVCGRVLCCTKWLKTPEAVNVKAARVQGLVITPSAVSGLCGRLKCCLWYEYDQYEEAIKQLPVAGNRVRCPHGEGFVVARDVLVNKLKIRLPDNREVTCGGEEIELLEDQDGN